ncbi:ArnT family glycosyltransferase [Neolewinella aurantiaca]|nr:glycosyltransferase family 39 protein [Neolewinella aurantiaca]
MQIPRKEINPLWLLIGWLTVNLIQAAFSPLDADETYYWMYAGDLAWGYFDHPPAVAVLIALGKDWLPGSLGLRFGHVLASTAMMAAMWHLLAKPQGKMLWLAAALVFAQPFFNVYGFIATPDGPLLLFSVLYLLAYRRFLSAPSITNGALWGLTMAGLLYSKYHGVMLIFFTVLPYLFWLLRQPGAWVAALGGAALFAPHLWWQYSNDYPSFRYHLSGRDDAYELKFTLEYLLNQLVIFSPLLTYHYILTFIRDRPETERFAVACRWLVIGFLIFFLYTTTKGGTEAQWTALLSIPLVYLLFRAVTGRFIVWQSRVFNLSIITIGLLIVARLLLIAPREALPFSKPFDHEPWTKELAERAGDRPVMVQNSYRLASLYQFYTGKPSWTFTDVEYRLNQYDLWTADAAFHDQEVLVLGQKSWDNPQGIPFRTQTRDMLTANVDNFQVVKGIRLEPATALPEVFSRGKEVNVELSAIIPRSIRTDSGLPLRLFIIFHYPDGDILYWKLRPENFTELSSGERLFTYGAPFVVPTDLPAGAAEVEFGLGYTGMPPLRGESERFEIVVE